tara:strand:+ start:303 stop:1055 length:753 start_codon:yes stop_codon:yes gene_type:complete
MNAIEIKDLRKTFDGEKYILDGITLNIPKGKITVIIGFSGTGKSVLIKHVLGLIRPTSGSINVLGTDIGLLNDEQMIRFRSHFGMLFQDAALFDDFTTIENVLFPIQEFRKDLSKEQKLEIAKLKLSQVGLSEEHYDKLPSELSGGMRKRCGLARAIALDPDILLYDEPTTGLDPVMTETVDNLILNTHNHNRESTTVVISHDLHAAFRLGDHIAMLDGGKVLLEGNAKTFFDSDIDLVQKFVAKGIKHE